MAKHDIHKKKRYFEKQCFFCDESIRYTPKTKPTLCPNCKKPEWDSGLEEHELNKIQRQYIELRDTFKVEEDHEKQEAIQKKMTDTLGKMYPHLVVIANKMISYMLRGKPLDDSTRQIRVADGVSSLIINYYKNSDLVIDKFTPYLTQCLKQALYNVKDKRNDGMLSLQFMVNENTDYESILPNWEENVEQTYLSTDTQELLELIQFMVDETFKKISSIASVRSASLTIVGINHWFTEPPEFMEQYYAYAGTKVKEYIELFMYMLRKVLLSRNRKEA